jgi:hypothetical protein
MTIAVALLALALAQETTIDADRPHVGTGPYVVEPAEVQFELGVLSQGSTDTRTFGSPALMRIGVVDRVELRVSSDGLLARYQTAADVYGVGNAQLGAKIRLDHGYVEAAGAPLVGARIAFDVSTVNGTQNVMMAATLARGETLIEGNYGIGAIGDRDSHGAAPHYRRRRRSDDAESQTYVEDAWWSRQERTGSAVSFASG